jgi:hypothetical protein
VAQYLGGTAVQLTTLMDDDARLMAVKVASTLPEEGWGERGGVEGEEKAGVR